MPEQHQLSHAEAAAVHATRTLTVLANLISAPYYVNSQVPFGISLPEWRTLREICEHPGITQTEIADRTAQHIMTLSRSVKQLTRKGLIDGRIDPDDRRRTCLYPTPTAAEMAAEMRRREAVQVRHIVGGITDDEADQFVRIMDKLIAHVRTTERPAPPPVSRDWRAVIEPLSES